MDWLTFISKAIDSLAWPVASIFLGLMFRKKLLELLPTLRKVKAGPLEAEFEIAAKQVLAHSAELGSADNKADAHPPKAGAGAGDVATQMLIARSEPTATIIEGWAKLDGELHKLGRQTGAAVGPVDSQQKVYQAIISSDVLPAESRQLVRELRHLRNQVAHAQVVPTPDSAQDYLVAVDRVMDLIRNYRKNLPGYTADVR